MYVGVSVCAGFRPMRREFRIEHPFAFKKKIILQEGPSNELFVARSFRLTRTPAMLWRDRWKGVGFVLRLCGWR